MAINTLLSSVKIHPFLSKFANLFNCCRNHVKLAIKSGDVEITQTFEDAKVAGGGWCNKSPRLRNIKATAKMVYDEVLLDSLDIDFFQEKNYTFFSG